MGVGIVLEKLRWKLVCVIGSKKFTQWFRRSGQSIDRKTKRNRWTTRKADWCVDVVQRERSPWWLEECKTGTESLSVQLMAQLGCCSQVSRVRSEPTWLSRSLTRNLMSPESWHCCSLICSLYRPPLHHHCLCSAEVRKNHMHHDNLNPKCSTMIWVATPPSLMIINSAKAMGENANTNTALHPPHRHPPLHHHCPLHWTSLLRTPSPPLRHHRHPLPPPLPIPGRDSRRGTMF